VAASLPEILAEFSRWTAGVTVRVDAVPLRRRAHRPDPLLGGYQLPDLPGDRPNWSAN